MIKVIPNILTSFRIICIPFIIILFAYNKIELSIILAIIASITDCLDGFLARKFNVESEFGAKLDAVSDKFFAGGLLLSLSIKYHNLFVAVALEIIISIINLYIHFKYKITKSLLIGKVKTWFLFVTVILGYISCFNQNFKTSMNIFLIITIMFQLICVSLYIKNGIIILNNKKSS